MSENKKFAFNLKIATIRSVGMLLNDIDSFFEMRRVCGGTRAGCPWCPGASRAMCTAISTLSGAHLASMKHWEKL